MKTVSQNTPTIYSATTPENNPPQLVASLVPDEQRISFWPQHFGLIPQWVTLEPRVFGWMDRLCEDYCGGIWNLYTLNNGGAFMAPEPDDDDDETWVLFNAMNGNRAEMSPEAAGSRWQPGFLLCRTWSALTLHNHITPVFTFIFCLQRYPIMKIITRGEAMRIHQQHPTSRLFPFCTGKYRWHGSAEAYTGREVQDIPGVLAVFAERRKDSFGPYVRLMSVTLN
ncbi:phage protein [Escherichia coli KTE61]|nr:phage protein [Escherichia coli KTE61]